MSRPPAVPPSLRPERHNLNLLLTLQVLLETRSTVLAAERLHRTQSAVSHALNRLREMFDDPLFVREGRALRPTSRALALELPVSRILADIVTVLHEPDGFVPASSRRRFRLALPNVCLPLLAELLERARREAPGVTFEVANVDRDSLEGLLVNRLDAVIAPPIGGAPERLHRRPLLTMDWAVFRRRRRGGGAAPTLERWLAAEHVQVVTGAGARSPVDDAVDALGRTRTVRCRVPDFPSAMVLLPTSELWLTVPRQALAGVARRMGLEAVDCPLALPPISLALYEHEPMREEPAQRWLRDLLLAAFGSVPTAVGGDRRGRRASKARD